MSIDLSKMPKLGFGLMRLPENDKVIDHEHLCRMVDEYMKAGMNYFDTAFMYHDGRSEVAIREALVKRYPRESFMLTDKLPVWMMKNESDRERIFNEQLSRCGVDYFDIYLLHSIEDGSNYNNYVKYNCFAFLQQLQAEGRVKHIGFSFHGTPELLDMILSEHTEIEVVQIQLNYADWENPVVQSGKLYEVLRKHDVPMLIMEPVKGGTLASAPEEADKLMREARPNASIASWALRFVGSLPGVMTVLSGMSTDEQMRDNISTFAHFEPLTEQDQAIIARTQAILLNQNTVACTACRYCTEGCPMGISIPDVFKALNTVRLYNEEFRPKAFYRELTLNTGKASDCVACGQCESVCPQHLPIIELLQEAAEKLEG